MSEDNLIPKRNVFSSLFAYYGFKLFLFRLGARSRLGFLGLYLLRVHFVVDFEGALGEDFEERFAIVVDVDHIVAGRGEDVFFVIDLEVEVRVSVTESSSEYDFVVRNVFAFS